MQFKSIELSDKALFDEIYEKNMYLGAERSFANSFIWRHGYGIEYALCHGKIFIRGKHGGETYYLMPAGEKCEGCCIESIINMVHEKSEKVIFKQLSKEEADMLSEKFGFVIEEDRDSADYIYLTEKMISLKGKKLHAKRNFLNRFKKTEYEYEAINRENIEEAKAFVLATLEKKTDTEDEEKSVNELFDNYFALCQSGAILRNKQGIIAVTVGEKLNKETAIIHLEKANADIPGAYTAINQMFLENQFADTKFVNREEDMGIEGLRQAKMSYYPDILLMKYTAREV